IIRTDPPFSRITVAISFGTVLFFLLVERYLFFRIEQRLIPRFKPIAHAVIIGVDSMALRLKQGLESESRLRTRVLGFLDMNDPDEDVAVPSAHIIGSLNDLDGLFAQRSIDMVLLADSSIHRDQLVQIMLECERRLIGFYLVPDIFRVMTSGVLVQTIDGIPLIGASRWPLDYFWNRLRKRAEDLAGALLGLLLSAPVILLAAWLIRRESPGPVFYRQTRCGERGKPFTLYKLRTMYADAEKDTGPVWTAPDDRRRTKAGAFLRRYNLDELPQFWNVFTGSMSLVGPRPERPHFVEQFKEDISRYMWRHRSKPGMTGWAQVNGLRGQTSLKDRIKYDLYYLENWSFSLDFKILLRTFFTRENAY
ncbi:MAG: sugar transferase, partial [Kiritimatiellae bacterium]|nr:sugar transferase [Kiritimatiellia bacterium]